MSEVNSKTEEKTTAATTKQIAKTVTASSKKVEKSVVIYIGPTIDEVVASNTIFNNGISKELENTIKEIPAVGKLIIPINQLSAARIQINTKNSALAVCYENVQKCVNKKGV